MKLRWERLKLVASPLVGFARQIFQSVGLITLSMVVGNAPKEVTIMVDFLLVNFPSAYNAIIGRQILNKLKAIPSIYHLKMKFSTDNRIGEVKCD